MIVKVKGGRWERWRRAGWAEVVLLSPPTGDGKDESEVLDRKSTFLPPSASSIPITILSSAVNDELPPSLDELELGGLSSTNENETTSGP